MSTPNLKKDLTYSSYDEFLKCSNFDFSTLDFNRPTICNSLLKLYDQGTKHLINGDDEKAYMLLMRFLEGIIKLRSSKLYRDDKAYVENFISMEKLKRTMTTLEDLKSTLKKRYEERDKKSNIVQDQKEDKNNEINKVSDSFKKLTTNNSVDKIDKKFIIPKELIEIIRKSLFKLLIIDIRSKPEFDYSHMDLNILLTEEIKKKQIISYINIPNDLIENVTWNICESLKKYDLSVAKTFSSRYEFDYLILFDKDTTSTTMKADSKLSILKRALYEYDFEKVKNEPIILDGGWSQWIIYYPGFKTSSNQVDLVINQNLQEEITKQTLKKTFDFDYPEFELSPKIAPVQPKIQMQNEIKQPSSNKTIQLENAVTNTVEQEEKVDIKDGINGKNLETDEPVKNTSILKPLIDRSNKPTSIAKDEVETSKETRNESTDAKNENIEPDQSKIEDKKNPENFKPTASIPSRLNKPEFKTEFKQDTKEEETSDVSKSKPSVSSVIKPPQVLNNNIENKNNNLNEMIFHSVYAPSRLNKPVHTPYMKDGSTKILNSETGLFSYHPSKSIKNESEQKQSVTSSPVPTPPQPKPKPVESKKPEIDSNKPFKPASSLKRTISSPNIANLDDESLNETEQTSNENKDKNVAINQISKPLNQVSSNQNNLIYKPIVNRNSKPMPDHVMRSRIEELQPVFGNVRPGLTGIRNLGNTCFMNSILQCLSNTEKLAKFFLMGHFKQDLNRKNDLGFRGEIADEFSVIIQSVWGGHCRIISPLRFKSIIGQFNQQFISNEQQDAQELLLFLLDGLHEDLNRVQIRPKISEKDEDNENFYDYEAANLAWKIHLSINNSIIVDLFQGQFKSTVTCSFCNKKSVKFDAFMYLTLPILSTRCDIYQCLELFLQPESMIGESKWKCPKCKQYRNAIKKIDIWKLPPLLIIHLKRFKYNGVWRDKITTNVDYPIDNLNLEQYVLSRDMKNSSKINGNNHSYHLYAISNHSGTLDGGHYTSMCRHFELNRWFRFDDTDVKEINNTSLLKSPMSYILFYSRN